MATYLIDGTTEIPENGDTGWGTTLNAAIQAIDGRFTWTGGQAVANKAAASGLTGTTLASNVVTSSLTSVGTLTSLSVSGALTVGGNLTVNGTTNTVNSTVTTLDDPIITLGGDTAPGSDDNKDRGVEFRWHNGSAAKLGFFGYDDSTGKFVFIPDATNSSEVFSGTLGTIDVGAVHINGSQISVSDLSTAKTGTGSIVLSNSPALSTPDLGTPSAATLTNATGLPVSTGITGLGANVATFLATPSSANLAAAVTDETGSGALVFGTSPDITTSITTSSTTFSLINTNATTVNFAGAASTISIGSVTSMTTLNGALTVSGTTVLGPASINQQSGSYTLVLGDAGKMLEVTNSSSNVTITVPPSINVNFPVGTQILVVRNGSGTVDFAAGAGVTLRSDASKFFIATQYSAATLVKRGTDEWYLVGNLSAS